MPSAPARRCVSCFHYKEWKACRRVTEPDWPVLWQSMTPGKEDQMNVHKHAFVFC